jgi:hypothetical protein
MGRKKRQRIWQKRLYQKKSGKRALHGEVPFFYRKLLRIFYKRKYRCAARFCSSVSVEKLPQI